MASTYTVNTGIELIANGEQSGTWGDTTNVNLEIIDRLTNGVGAITLSGTTHTITTTDGTLSDGQFKVLVFGGSPSGTNTVTISPNDQDKQYFILNSSGQSVVLTQGSGGNVTIANGKSAIVFADGGGAGAAVTDLTATFVPSGALLTANNLSDLADAPTALSNLGVTASAAELNYNDITTLGTSEASKVVTADANGVVIFDGGIVEDETAVTSTTNATTVNCRDGNVFTHVLTENTTFTFSDPPASGRAFGFTLKIVQDASASGYTVTWPASVDWPSATAPTLTATASAVDVFVFYTHDWWDYVLRLRRWSGIGVIT
jgi:hypothetical protein